MTGQPQPPVLRGAFLSHGAFSATRDHTLIHVGLARLPDRDSYCEIGPEAARASQTGASPTPAQQTGRAPGLFVQQDRQDAQGNGCCIGAPSITGVAKHPHWKAWATAAISQRGTTVERPIHRLNRRAFEDGHTQEGGGMLCTEDGRLAHDHYEARQTRRGRSGPIGQATERRGTERGREERREEEPREE
jgi:hypothetical protein